MLKETYKNICEKQKAFLIGSLNLFKCYMPTSAEDIFGMGSQFYSGSQNITCSNRANNIYIYIYIYIYFQEKTESGLFRVINLFPSC